MIANNPKHRLGNSNKYYTQKYIEQSIRQESISLLCVHNDKSIITKNTIDDKDDSKTVIFANENHNVAEKIQTIENIITTTKKGINYLERIVGK